MQPAIIALPMAGVLEEGQLVTVEKLTWTVMQAVQRVHS